LRDRAKKHCKVAEHKSFDADLANLHISNPVGADSDHPSIRPLIGADIVVTGTVERKGDTYILQSNPFVVGKRKTLSSLGLEIVSNEFLDSMVVSFPASVSPAGKDGVGMPSCVYCPDPSYSELARSKKISGVCVLTVLLSAEGAAQQIRLEKMLGYGLDEKA
jgi:hypothetical protein